MIRDFSLPTGWTFGGPGWHEAHMRKWNEPQCRTYKQMIACTGCVGKEGWFTTCFYPFGTAICPKCGRRLV